MLRARNRRTLRDRTHSITVASRNTSCTNYCLPVQSATQARLTNVWKATDPVRIGLWRNRNVPQSDSIFLWYRASRNAVAFGSFVYFGTADSSHQPGSLPEPNASGETHSQSSGDWKRCCRQTFAASHFTNCGWQEASGHGRGQWRNDFSY